MLKYILGLALVSCAHTDILPTSPSKCQESAHVFVPPDAICPTGTYIEWKDFDVFRNQQIYMCHCRRAD